MYVIVENIFGNNFKTAMMEVCVSAFFIFKPHKLSASVIAVRDVKITSKKNLCGTKKKQITYIMYTHVYIVKVICVSL